VYGGPGDDKEIDGGSGNDVIEDGPGDDQDITGDQGDDTMYFGAGADRGWGEEGFNTIYAFPDGSVDRLVCGGPDGGTGEVYYDGTPQELEQDGDVVVDCEDIFFNSPAPS
jgi:Ca2+-binding RTX toxin-like protein